MADPNDLNYLRGYDPNLELYDSGDDRIAAMMGGQQEDNPYQPYDFGSLGTNLFGQAPGPLPFEARPGVQPSPNPYSPGMPGPDEAPPADTTDYDQIVKEHLKELQRPVSLPRPGLSNPLAVTLALADPQAAKNAAAMLDRGYQARLQETQLNLNRQGQAATLASQLAEREQARKDRMYQQNWMHESAAANAGNVNFPYQIPGMAEVARQRQALGNALISQRNRSGLMKGPRPKFATRMDHLAWLETMMRTRQSQLTNMYNSQSPYLPENPGHQAVREDSEQDYGRLRRMRSVIGKMTDDQWQRFNQLSDDDQDAIIDATGAGGGPPPQPAPNYVQMPQYQGGGQATEPWNPGVTPVPGGTR